MLNFGEQSLPIYGMTEVPKLYNWMDFEIRNFFVLVSRPGKCLCNYSLEKSPKNIFAAIFF